jgi:hypothetical protein
MVVCHLAKQGLTPAANVCSYAEPDNRALDAPADVQSHSSVCSCMQKEACAEHVDLAAYDKATLAAANAIFGQNAVTFAELPVLPVAPWNRQPGYLVSAVLTGSMAYIKVHSVCAAACSSGLAGCACAEPYDMLCWHTAGPPDDRPGGGTCHNADQVPGLQALSQ